MRKSSLVRLILAGLLLGGVWVAYTYQGPAPSKLDTQKIATDLYVIHNDRVPGNTTVLVTSDGVVMVDDKFPVDVDNILAEVKKVTSQPVKYVVNTHHHGDHSGGNAKLQAMGVQVVTSEQARQYMVDGKQSGLSNIAFEGHMHIYLGGKNVELYYFGKSHTGGDIVAYFPAQRAIAMGDMYTHGDGLPELVDYSGGGSAKEWTGTVDRALKLDFDTVVPGHGDVTTKAELAKFRQSTVSLRNKVHEMVAAKASRADIEKMLRSDFGFGDLHVNVSLDGLMAELR
jgi:glyoxylase-like metal-dependent hydrolase (beta-lactamase superfamily II)